MNLKWVLENKEKARAILGYVVKYKKPNKIYYKVQLGTLTPSLHCFDEAYNNPYLFKEYKNIKEAKEALFKAIEYELSLI